MIHAVFRVCDIVGAVRVCMCVHACYDASHLNPKGSAGVCYICSAQVCVTYVWRAPLTRVM